MIKVALTNLGKYNEGELVYRWLELPATRAEIDEAKADIGIDGEEYEEYFITDYEAPWNIHEYTNLDALNELVEQLDGLPEFEDIANDTYDAGDVINFAHELCNAGLVPHADEYVQDIVDDETLDELTAQQAKEGGWQRVKYFLGGIDYMNDDFYRINGYGNAENIDSDYLRALVDDLILEVAGNV